MSAIFEMVAWNSVVKDVGVFLSTFSVKAVFLYLSCPVLEKRHQFETL